MLPLSIVNFIQYTCCAVCTVHMFGHISHLEAHSNASLFFVLCVHVNVCVCIFASSLFPYLIFTLGP